MNRSLHLPGTSRSSGRLLLSLALLGGASLSQQAAAQSAPDLSAYRSMASALDKAVADRPGNSASSLADLDRAAVAYAALKPGISSSLLTGGMERSMQSARSALSRAPADLEAQIEQTRSLMRKALYDQTLAELGQATVTPAQAGLLASEFGLQDAVRSRFLGVVATRDAGSAARLLRSAAAQKVQANLSGASVPQGAAQAQNNAQRTATYLALARATGWFTVVQDAPDTGGLKLSLFTQALGQLTGNNTAALSSTLSALRSGAAAFVSASARAVKSGRSVPASSTPATTVPVASGTVDTGTVGTATPAIGQPNSGQSNLGQPSSGLSAVQQQASLNAAYSALARAQAAAGHADPGEARTQLGRASRALTSSGLSSTAGYDALSADLSSLETRNGLRSIDVQAVIAGLNSLERFAQSQPISTLDSASVSVAKVAPPVWPLLFLIVGLLALYPLYLLNLAFGGRNNFWRAIAASLLLLSLPLLLEGLGGTFAYLGDLFGVPLLRSLGNLSLHQGAWGLPIWLLLSAAAVALSSYGFRGLCRQFGLLGGSRSSNPTSIGSEAAQPALDWDEEL